MEEFKEASFSTIDISKSLGVQHRSLMNLIKTHKKYLDNIDTLKIKKLQKDGRPLEYYILSLKQYTFLSLLMKNSKEIVEFKHHISSEIYRLQMVIADLFLENMDFKHIIEMIKKEKVTKSFDPLIEAIKATKNMPKETGCVYIIKRKSGDIKIGRSINPEQRTRDVITQMGDDDVDVFISKRTTEYRKIEIELQKKFKGDRKLGEWFNVDFEIAKESLIKIISLENNNETN